MTFPDYGPPADQVRCSRTTFDASRDRGKHCPNVTQAPIQPCRRSAKGSTTGAPRRPCSAVARDLCDKAAKVQHASAATVDPAKNLPETGSNSRGTTETMDEMTVMRPDPVAVDAHRRKAFWPDFPGGFWLDGWFCHRATLWFCWGMGKSYKLDGRSMLRLGRRGPALGAAPGLPTFSN